MTSSTARVGELAGKVAIVTGAGQGIGRAIATILADHGAAISVFDLNEKSTQSLVAEVGAGGGRAIAVVGNVSDPADVTRAVAATVEAFGTVDILVNNAGVLRPGPIERIDPEEWDLIIDVGLKGAFLFMQAVAPIMKQKRAGKIVNMASMAGRATSTLGGAHYTAAKAGLLGLSRHVARELAPFGINVNSVNPGIIDTPMAQAHTAPARLEEIRLAIPFQRFGSPNEVAELVLFLASERSSYVTGAGVDIHGGEMII